MRLFVDDHTLPGNSRKRKRGAHGLFCDDDDDSSGMILDKYKLRILRHKDIKSVMLLRVVGVLLENLSCYYRHIIIRR